MGRIASSVRGVVVFVGVAGAACRRTSPAVHAKTPILATASSRAAVLAPSPSTTAVLQPCAPPPATRRPPYFLSITHHFDRTLVGNPSIVSPMCGDLAILDPSQGLRILDPGLGRFVANPIAAQEDQDPGSPLSFASTARGGLVVWESAGSIDLRDRGSGALFWKKGTSVLGVIAEAGDQLVYQSGRACTPTCELVAIEESAGRELWRQPCACDKSFATTTDAFVYGDVQRFGGVLVGARKGGLDAFDPATGRVVWQRALAGADGVILGDHLFSVEYDPPYRVRILDSSGQEVGSILPPRGSPFLETVAADAHTLFVVASDAPLDAREGRTSGGRAHVTIVGFDLETQREVFRSRGHAMAGSNPPVVERKLAGMAPALWVNDPAVVFYDEIDSGLLSAYDRATGNLVSTLGVEGQELVRTESGFALVGEAGIDLVEPSDTESPPSEHATITGVFHLNGKPARGVTLVVGDVEVTTGAGGAFSASVVGRGSFAVHVRQPRPETGFWAQGDARVTLDGRSAPYRVDLDAVTDTFD